MADSGGTKILITITISLILISIGFSGCIRGEDNNGINNTNHSSNQINSRSKYKDIDNGIRITNSPSNKINSDICDNIIVYEDDRNVNEEDWLTITNVDIFGFDLLKNEEFPICTNPYRQGYPKIYGNNVVWQDHRNDPDGDIGGEFHNADIYIFNLITKEEIQITNDPNDQLYPDIYENNVVWADFRDTTDFGSNDYNIYMYNLETHEEHRITDAFRSQTKPNIYGNYIVWEDWRYSRSDIFYYDMSTEEENYITRDTNYQNDPEIYENKIAWSDGRNGNKDIYLFDLETNEEKQITNNPEIQRDPEIYNNFIIWIDHRNKVDEDDWNTDIYAYDLDIEEEIQIRKNIAGQDYLSIYENEIVCSDGRNEYIEIYLYDLSTFDSQINHRPIIRSIMADPQIIEPNKSSIISVDAIDEDGDDLFYTYQSSEGTIEEMNSSAKWTAPEFEGNYSIIVTVSDNKIDSIPKSINITVKNKNSNINNNEKIDDKSESDENNDNVSIIFRYGIYFLMIAIFISRC